jgi:hypothetical protein
MGPHTPGTTVHGQRYCESSQRHERHRLTSDMVKSRLGNSLTFSITFSASPASRDIGTSILYSSSWTCATSSFSSRSVRKAIALSCLPPTEIGWDLALPTASVKYSRRVSKERSILKSK